MTEDKTLTTASGIPVADNQNSLTAGERGPILMQDFYPDGKTGSLQPGTHSWTRCPCKRSRCIWHVYRHPWHYSLNQSSYILRSWQRNSGSPAFLYRRRRTRFSGCRTWPQRFFDQVLHRRRKQGFSRQQHAYFLHPRSAQIPWFDPHAKAPSPNASQRSWRQVGFLVLESRSFASGDNSVFRSRYPEKPPPHGRFWQPYLQPNQFSRRTGLVQIPLQISLDETRRTAAACR